MLSTPKAKAELYLASSLYDGLEDNNIMQVTTLLLNKEADPNVLIPSQGITPFHLVIGNDSETFAEEVTKLFLRHGGNPNVKSVDGMTPVHVAAAWGRLGVLELLLSNGGDPLLVDDDGRCSFHYAFDEAHYDAVATLGKYCGESFEEDSDHKYNIALDKILVCNGDVVAEYAVSEDTLATTAYNVQAIRTCNISNNNNNSLRKPNQKFGEFLNVGIQVYKQDIKYAVNDNITITTTADESSASLPRFVNVRRHRRCLPRKKPKYVKYKLENENKSEQEERDLCQANIPALDNRLSISHLNDPIIEASFLVEPQKVGENMPCVSSPKKGTELIKPKCLTGLSYRTVKSPKTTPQNNTKAASKNKFVHKTPLRCYSKRQPPTETKKTPTTIPAKKTSNLNCKTDPNNGKFLTKDDRALIHTPSRYFSNKTSYSPDCSIISKSPNLVSMPRTPTNNYRVREETKKKSMTSTGTPPVKNYKRIPVYGSGYKTPTPNKVFSNGNSGKNFSCFTKQSELRHQGPKQSPTWSPSRFREYPTWSKNSARTPNLTDSTKQKNEFPTGRPNNALSPLYSQACSPTTPLNKTYSKRGYFNAAALSPDIEIANRYVDRRNLAKNIAIKLEETMYDDDDEKNIMNTDVEQFSKIPDTMTLVRGSAKTAARFVSPIAVERNMSNITNNRFKCINERMNLDHLTSIKCCQISGVNTIADSIKLSEIEAIGIRSSELDKNSRGSNIIAGFFQLDGVDVSSVRTSSGNNIMNNDIVPKISRPESNLFVGNSLRIENPVNSLTCLTNCTNNRKDRSDHVAALVACSQHPNSKEIDESLISSERSDCSVDNHVTAPQDLGNTDLSMGQGALLNGGVALESNTCESEFPPPRSTGDGYTIGRQKTCSIFPNVSSSIDNSSFASFVSVEEEYKYEDAEEGVILLERRFLTTPISIPLIKPEERVPSSSGSSSQCLDDESMESCVSSMPHSLIIMDSETLRKELTKLDCRPPGPITATTRHIYLKRLRRLQKFGPAPLYSNIAVPPKFSTEVERTLRSDSWMNDLSLYETLEQQVFSEFSSPDPTRRWREGVSKSSFNYLLMDPRITDNLPRRVNVLSAIDCWQTFLSSIFYVGKGRRSRPYAHLYQAYGEWKKGIKETSDKKINYILDIWKNNCGVVCLHFFQNTIPVEAYTREAAMIEALGLDKLKNSKSGDYYGVAATWSHHQKRTLGIFLLYKAMHILINEGERQLSPDDIGR